MPARPRAPQRPTTAQADKTAVLYARVSSKEQEQGFSIPAQLRLLHEYAQQREFKVLKEFTDVETAKRTGRTAFTEMLAFLRKQRCRTVLVEKTDRLLRNLKDYVILDELALDLHFVKENVILNQDSKSSEKFMHGIKVLMAKNYIDNLSEETRKGMLEKARSGLWPSYAPAGYQNTISEDGKRIIIPDPATAPVIKQLYEWFATGQYSLKAVAAKARLDGLRLGDAKLHKSEVHHVLRKRLYSGDFDWDGITYHGTHEPLISKATWERVQELLDAKTIRKLMKHDFPYSGIVTCGHCGLQLVGEIKKQRYVYYHCTGYHGKCPEPYTRQERLDQAFQTIIDSLVVPQPIIDYLRAAIANDDQATTQANQQALASAQSAYDRLSARLDAMYLDKLDGRITTHYYDEKATAWRAEQTALRTKINDLTTASQRYEEAINSIETVSNLCKAFPQKSPSEQRRLLKTIISNATWQRGEFEATLQTPFEKLRLSNHASTTKQGKNGNGGTEMKNWLPGMDSNHDSRKPFGMCNLQILKRPRLPKRTRNTPIGTASVQSGSESAGHDFEDEERHMLAVVARCGAQRCCG